MIRNLKILGLALAAAFALSALAASAALAQKQGILTTEGGVATTLDISEVDATHNYLEDPELKEKVECPGSTFVGHKQTKESETSAEEKSGAKPHSGLIPNKATVATISSTLINCKAGSHKATVTNNGCDFDFTIGKTTVEGVEPYALTADIVCPAGKVIEKHVYLSSASEATTICTYTIGPQTVSGFDISNDPKSGEKPDDLTVTGTANLVATRDGLCGAKANLNVTQAISYTVQGTNAAGALIGITVSD